MLSRRLASILCIVSATFCTLTRAHYPTYASTARRPNHADYMAVELPDCPHASASHYFRRCNDACDHVAVKPVALPFPPVTATGKRTVDVVQDALALAWARNTHRIDLWLRTGCHGAHELKFLLASVELFWPRGIGRVVLVLDESDRAIVRHLVPNDTRHDYSVVHEDVPCMMPRVFNQVSYMMADYHSSADILVTIDSDCILHSPVTPRLLFSQDGRIRLPHSRALQTGMWDGAVEVFLGAGTFKWHTMVSQPVTFHRTTFGAYRDWYARTRGECYLDGVARALGTVDNTTMMSFCWMCQLGTFLDVTGVTAERYELVDVDTPSQNPYQRLSVHVPYELAPGADFEATARLAVNQGLCLALGSTVLPECAGADTSYVRERMFKYHTYDWVADADVKKKVMNAYVTNVRRLVNRARRAETPRRVLDQRVWATRRESKV